MLWCFQNFRQWIEDLEVDVTCSYPPRYSGKHLKHLEIEDLVCENGGSSFVRKTTTSITTDQEMSSLCPLECDCAQDINHVNCNARQKTHVPTNLPLSTVLLDLRENK